MRRVDLLDERVDGGRVGHVVARGVEVARVEADAEPRVAVERARRASRARRSSGRSCAPAPAEFSISSHVSPSQRSRICASAAARALEPGLEARAEVRADVEDDAVGLDRARGVDRRAQRRDRLLVDRVVGRGEVAEVERVARRRRRCPASRAPRLETLDRLRRVSRRPPHARALREHLHAVAADRLDPVDRRVDAARRRDVRAELHRVPTIERRCPSASAWLRARPASSTSEACARSSSTGSSRASTAASACCGSRTPTRAARSPRRSTRSRTSLRWLGIDWDGAGHVPARHGRHGARARAAAPRRRARRTRTTARSASASPTRARSSWDDAVRGADRVQERAARTTS